MSRKKRLLTKNILCAVMAASVVSFSGTVLAADNVEHGTIHVDENGTIIGNTVQNDVTEITGGTITVTDEEAQEYDDRGISAIQIKGEGKYFTVNDVDITGGVSVRNGATLTINDSTATAGAYYVDGVINGGTDFKTEGGTLIVSNSNVKSEIYAGESDDGKHTTGVITFNNTNIDTNTQYEPGDMVADYNSRIILNGNKDNTYKVGRFLAALNDENYQNPGKIEINGGTLIADNLRNLVDGSLLKPDAVDGFTQADIDELKAHTVKGGIVLKDNGVIQTKTGQIYEHGIDTTNDETVLASTDSGRVTNDYISYEGGTINFTDEKYSQAYLDSAVKNMAEKGNTNINMLGTLINEQGEVVSNITVDEAVANGNVQTNATVNTNDNITKLVVGNGTTDTDTQYSNGSFTAARLAVDKNTSDIEITDGQTLGLGGKNGGELITGNAGNLNITVNNNDSKLILGRSGLNADNRLTANVTVNSGAVEAVSGNTTVNGDINLNGGTLNVNGNAILTANKALTAQNGVNINIGNEGSSGTLLAGDVKLNGAAVYLDPVWKDGQTIGDASKAGLVFAENTNIDGNLIVGENSVLTLGSTNTDLAERAFGKTGQEWGNGENDVLSAVYVASPQDISNGSLFVDKNATGTESLQKGEVNFGKNSILMIDGSKINGTTVAINGVTAAQVAQNDEDKQNGAKLYIDNAENKQSYTILAGTGVEATDKWADENVVADNILLGFTSEEGTNTYTAMYKKVADVFGNDVVIPNIIDGALASNDTNSAAYKFFNKAASEHYNAGYEAKATAFNSVANMGELAGVNHGTYSISNTMTDAVADHLSLANHGQQDNDIWARYIHSEEDIDGMKLGGLNADYDATYNGIIVGGDFYKNGKGTIGLALAYADGDIDGSNIASRTENDAEYYGASLYGRIDNGDSALIGDISFLHSSNDITQYNSGEKITASPDADAFSIGLRAEKEIQAGENGKLVPYMGVRYMHLGAADYTNSLGINYDTDEQNLFLLPVGLKYTAEIKHNDWTVKPMAEVGYVWNFGDKDTDQTISLNGVSDTFGFDTVDDGTFIGRLGIEAESDKMAYGIGYEYQNGDSSSVDKWMANVVFKF